MPKYIKITEEYKKTKEYEEYREKRKKISRKYYANNIEKSRERTNEWRAKNPERAKDQLAEWRLKNPDKIYAITKRYRDNNPEKDKAHKLVEKAIVSGKLIVPDFCSVCNSTKKLDAHHEDYSKPLDVVWICRQCHKDEHSKQLKGVA